MAMVWQCSKVYVCIMGVNGYHFADKVILFGVQYWIYLEKPGYSTCCISIAGDGLTAHEGRASAVIVLTQFSYSIMDLVPKW